MIAVQSVKIGMESDLESGAFYIVFVLVVQFVAEFFHASNWDFQELKYLADLQTYR